MRIGFRLISLMAVAVTLGWGPGAPVRLAPQTAHATGAWSWNPRAATPADATTPFLGMGIWWTTWGNVTTGDAQALVTQAKNAGMLAIFPRVADSVNGFYGTEIIDTLVPLAHANGLYVIGWYWSDLGDPQQAIQVADYATSGGQKLDAISPDIEAEGYDTSVNIWMHNHGLTPGRDTAPAWITAMKPNGAPYGVLDTYFNGIRNGAGGLTGLGANYPIAATSWPTPYNHGDYSFAAMSKWCQVFTPMAYWRATQIYSGVTGVEQYIDLVFSQYHDASINPDNRVLAPIGQAYDAGGPLAGNPPAAEITAFLHETQLNGGVGASLYDSNDINSDEWGAVANYTWGKGHKRHHPDLGPMAVTQCAGGCTVYTTIGTGCTLQNAMTVSAGQAAGYVGLKNVKGCASPVAIFSVPTSGGYDVPAYAATNAGWMLGIKQGHTLATVNLRTGPGCTFSVLTQVSGVFTIPTPHKTIKLTNSTGPTCHADSAWHEWWNVTYNGQTGWIWGVDAAAN